MKLIIRNISDDDPKLTKEIIAGGLEYIGERIELGYIEGLTAIGDNDVFWKIVDDEEETELHEKRKKRAKEALETLKNFVEA